MNLYVGDDLKFEHLDELRRWLRTKPAEWGQVIACRAALRVVPLVETALDGRDLLQLDASESVLYSFRAVFISWATRKYPAFQMRPTADAAVAVEATVKASSKAASYAANSAVNAAYAASATTSYATNVGAIDAAANAAAYAVAYAAEAAGIYAATTGVAGAAFAEGQVWSAVSMDAERLESNLDGRLINQPLWLSDVREDDRYRANIPPWVRAALDGLADSDFASQHGFDPWIAWYRSIIPNIIGAAPGNHFGETLTFKIVGQPNEWWERSASAVNADILEWLKERQSDPEFGEDLKTALENLPAQTPAAYRFHWKDNRIVAAPPDPSPGNSAVAQDLLDETRRKAGTLSESLRRSNADPHVQRTVSGLLDALPTTVSELRPGLLLSRARSVEAVAAAYAGPDDERELFPGAIAQILDLSETVRDLQGCLPEIREIEAERMALEIDPTKVDQIAQHVDDIIEKAVVDETIVDNSAKDALRTIADNADEGASPQVKQRLVADRVLVVRNFLSPIYRFALASKLANEVTDVRREAWEKARPKFIDGAADGLGSMGRPIAVIGVSSLVALLFGPTAGLAAMLAGFGKIDQLVKLLQKRLENGRSGADPEPDDDNADDDPSGPAAD